MVVFKESGGGGWFCVAVLFQCVLFQENQESLIKALLREGTSPQNQIRPNKIIPVFP